jgi:hypothetical protein
MCVIAVVVAGCSTGEASERERLQEAIRELAEAGAPSRVPSAAPVDTVVCEPLTVPTYACTVTYGEGADVVLYPFCAELRRDAVYMNSSKEGCGPSSEGQSFKRSTRDDFG